MKQFFVRLFPGAALVALLFVVPASLRADAVHPFIMRGIEQLYSHQARSFEIVDKGENLVVVTPTASGKTLCYNAPVLDAILKDPSTRALYLFPTKALAQDQLAELHGLAELAIHHGAPEIGVFTYDGDTPSDARRAIRGKAHVALSNPDMLHSGILPHHPRWAKLFENLKFVIVDELHAYRGVFGSHLSNILRRLQRVCRHYGSDPIFICSSSMLPDASTTHTMSTLGLEGGGADTIVPTQPSAGRAPPPAEPLFVTVTTGDLMSCVGMAVSALLGAPPLAALGAPAIPALVALAPVILAADGGDLLEQLNSATHKHMHPAARATRAPNQPRSNIPSS